MQRGQNNKIQIMPLFFQSFPSDDCRLAVWHIAEEEAFFRTLALPQRAVSHPHKRLQHLAGRYLLRYLFPDFPTELIQIADTRKPYLHDDVYHFSISHCSDYAAAIVSPQLRVGVDIEVVTEKAVRIRHKFASAEEWTLVQNALAVAQFDFDDGIKADKAFDPDALIATLIWSCKEAVFKWYGAGEIDFIKHIDISGCRVENFVVVTEVGFTKENPVLLRLHSVLLDSIWLSYVVK